MFTEDMGNYILQSKLFNVLHGTTLNKYRLSCLHLISTTQLHARNFFHIKLSLTTLNKMSKWYIVYICRVYRKGLNADKSYHYFDFLWIIKKHNVVFVHFKSGCKYQFTGKTMTSKAKWRLKPKLSRCRKCCASVKLLSEESFRWLPKCIEWLVLPELSQFSR